MPYSRTPAELRTLDQRGEHRLAAGVCRDLGQHETGELDDRGSGALDDGEQLLGGADPHEQQRQCGMPLGVQAPAAGDDVVLRERHVVVRDGVLEAPDVAGHPGGSSAHRVVGQRRPGAGL